MAGSAGGPRRRAVRSSTSCGPAPRIASISPGVLISTIYQTLQARPGLDASDAALGRDGGARAIGLGARLRLDRSEDQDEQLRVYADPSGHLFCIFLAPE